MFEKRKDSRGRILKDGESQRKNGSYMYRYTDIHKKRQYVYANTLTELRKQEEIIKRDLADGIDYSAGEISVAELVDRYINLKRDLKENSKRAYGTAINRIHTSDFGHRRVKEIKLSDAKGWYVELHDGGMKQNTIGIVHNVLRPAFEMAVDDDMIRKNPFKFKLSDVVPNDAYVRNALTKAQQERYLRFVHACGGNYYDDIVILLGTGLRVSELYGLTKSDIDFERGCVHVQRQLCQTADKPYFVTAPKTSSGNRCIPMTATVCETFKHILASRGFPKVEMLVDGCSGFLFLDKNGKPKVGMHLQNYMRGIRKKWVKQYGNTFPSVTPYVLRHAFCTDMQRAGIDVKCLQYLMGHSNVSVTLDVYTHTDYEAVEQAFRRVAAGF